MRKITTLVVLLASAASAQTRLTAADAIAKIQKRYASAPPANTVDTVKAGDPSTPVAGIAVTFLDTMDVLREAARRGDNLIITHEPTFYNHRDDARFLKEDAVYKEKLAFINEHHLVVFRLHDEIHSSPDDPIRPSLGQLLRGSKGTVDPSDPSRINYPGVRLDTLAAQIQSTLHAQTMRIVGDPAMLVHQAIVRPGAAGLEAQVAALEQKDVDLLIAGEASEWETVEYARDAVAQGRHKALILIGHEPSEEPGMIEAAKQIQQLFPGIKVEHIAAGQSMWSPTTRLHL